MRPMRMWSRIRSWWHAIAKRSRMESEMDVELRFHIEAFAEDLVRSGVPREEALRHARIEFGGIERAKEECRDARGTRFVETLFQDVRFGLRMLRKSPGFTAVAVLTLALGIGANSTIFSLIDAVMLKSLPVRDPQHLFLLHWSARAKPKTHGYNSYGDCATADWQNLTNGCSLSKPFLEDVRKLGVFSDIAEFARYGGLTLSGNGPASQVNGQFVSGDYFETLGVRATYGRVFTPADDAPGAAAVVVLRYGYWQQQFGSDLSVIGRTVHLNGLPFTVIGVTEQTFTFLTPGTSRDLWVPIAQRQYVSWWWKPESDDAGSWWIVAVGRLKPGVSRAEAQDKISALFVNDTIHGNKPIFSPQDDAAITLLPAQDALTGVREDVSTMLFTLMLAVGIVLLIACANVAGLMLARAASRQKEIAIRLAIGAGRARLLRQLLTESLTLSAAGGVLGILLAYWAAPALLAFATSTFDHPLDISVQPDWRVLGFTLAAAALTGIFFGLAPAFRAMRVDLTPALKEGGRKGSASGQMARGRFTLGNSLVVAQVALTVVVLVGAGLVVHTLQNLRNINPGFDTNNLLNFDLDTALTGYKGDRLQQFYEDLRSRFSAIPGVLSASYTEDRLLAGWLSTNDFHAPGTPPKTSSEADWLPIGPNYFATMKIPVLSGRNFLPEEYVTAAKITAAAIAGDPKVAEKWPEAAIVNEAFVRAYFPHVNPIGQRFGANGPDQTGDPDTEKTAGWFIVGVVRDAKYNSLRREVQPTMYVPATSGSFEIRTAGNPLAVMPAIREIVHHAGNDIPITGVKTQTQQIDNQLYRERLIARLSSFFGMLALLLACIGLYGLLAYEVTRGTREIGIRMALGAQAGNVLRTVVARGVALALIGVAIGTAASLAVARYLSTMLFGVKPTDPATLTAVAALLLVVALAASYVPARRATRVDPMVALRYE